MGVARVLEVVLRCDPWSASKWIYYTLRKKRVLISARILGRNLLIRSATPDMEVALSCFGGEFSEIEKFLPREADGIIIDAGGYIGASAIIFSELYPNARVVVLEPSKENFSILQENVKNYKNIFPLNCALNDSGGTVSLRNRGTGPWGFSIVQPPDEGLAPILEDAICITVNDILMKFDSEIIDLFKIDIEGSEYELFKDCPCWINKTRVICIELHDRIVDGCTAAFFKSVKGRKNFSSKGEKVFSVLS